MPRKPIDYTPRGQKKEEEEPVLTFTPCLVCQNKILRGFYGRWDGGGTCSLTCERVMEKQRHGGYYESEGS